MADGGITDSWGASVEVVVDGYIVLRSEEWNRGPQATAGFITQGANPPA